MVDFEQDIKRSLEVLHEGGLILYPTDTIWGIGCDAQNEQAIERIFRLKKRPIEKQFIVLLADVKDILHYVAAPPPDIIAMVEAFERPTTVIFDHHLELPAMLASETIAIRVTTDPFCKALIKRYRNPIVSTSANVSGQATPLHFGEIQPEIISGVGYLVNWRQNERLPAKPSRVIRADDEGNIVVIRD